MVTLRKNKRVRHAEDVVLPALGLLGHGLGAGLQEVEGPALVLYKQVNNASKLTRNEGHGIELLPPLFVDADLVGFGLLTSCGEPLLIGVSDQLLAVGGVRGVEHVVEVLAVWIAAFGKLVREVDLEAGDLLHLFVEALHTEFIVERDLDELDFGELEELLLAHKHLAQHVLVDHRAWRDVELH